MTKTACAIGSCYKDVTPPIENKKTHHFSRETRVNVHILKQLKN